MRVLDSTEVLKKTLGEVLADFAIGVGRPAQISLQLDSSLWKYLAYFETVEGPPHHSIPSTGSVTREFADDFDSISFF
jgi:hypothetical protein